MILVIVVLDLMILVAEAKALSKEHPMYPTKTEPSSRLDGECIAFDGPDVDECGVCFGDGIADGACDCDGNVLDCAGDCNGDAIVDDCGQCNGDGTTCLPETIEIGNVTASTLEILYSSSESIAGFQFNVTGVELLGGSGGAAEEAGFTITVGDSIVLGFSFENNVIPPGTGLLTTLDVVVVDFEACLEGVVISDPNAQEIDFEVGGCADLTM